MLTALIASVVVVKTDFVFGIQAWTYHRFTTFEAIEMAAQAGAENIELYPGQELKPGSDVGVGPEMPASALGELEAQLTKFHLRPVAFGVTGISRDPNEARKLFRWAKGLHLMVINTESTDAIDTIEQMVKEFDIKVGFHDHPRQPNNPNYKMWDPNYVLSVLRNRDRRIGSCADIGHWVRSGIKPIEAVRILKGRIVSSHLKDLNEFSPNGHDVPFGTGISGIAEVLAEYRRQRFNGPADVEYEYHEENPQAEAAACVGFLRGWAARE